MLKSEEIKIEFEQLQASLKAKAEKKELITQEEQTKLTDLKNAYECAFAAEQVEKIKLEGKGVKKMGNLNEKDMKNKIFKAMLKKADFTDEMRASGYLATVGSNGQIGVITESITGERGGYLVPEEFLTVERNGEGLVISCPCRTISVNEPIGKIPTFDVSQGAGDGKFLYSFDELDTISETNALFGQLNYNCVDKAGIVPISRRLLDDAASDVVSMVSECIATAAVYQKSADVLTAISGISGLKTEYLGSGKTFADKEAMKAFVKTIRGTLKGSNRANAKIVMCDTDFAKLATLQMTNGEYYLKPMAYDASRYMVEGVEVIALDDKLFTTTSGTTTTVGGSCFVGNFNKVAYVERKGLEISSDYSAGFTRDALLVKGIKRACALVLDGQAFVKIAEGAAPEISSGT